MLPRQWERRRPSLPVLRAVASCHRPAPFSASPRQPACAFGSASSRNRPRMEGILIGHVGHGPDDRKHAVELLHADLAFDHGDGFSVSYEGLREGKAFTKIKFTVEKTDAREA